MIENYGVLLYGGRYLGTTSMVKALPNVLHIDVGPFGTVKEWSDFKDIVTGWDPESNAPEHIAIDKISSLYDLCVEHICVEQSVVNIHELGANKWSLVEKEMTSVFYDFYKLPGVKWYVAGSKVEELQTSLFTGNLTHPELDWMLKKILPNITHRTLYMGVEQFKRELDADGREILTRIPAQRVLICSPVSGIVSGDSFGVFPKRMPIKDTGEQAVARYLKYEKGKIA